MTSIRRHYLMLGLLLFATCCMVVPAQAQLGKRLLRAAERGAERALERNAQKKTEDAVDDVFDGPDADKQSRPTDNSGGSQAENSGATAPAEARTGGSTVGSNASDGSSSAGGVIASTGAEGEAATAEDEGPAFAMNSKYDFEPGANVVFYDDFERTAMGDFPTGYNTMGSSEIVTLNTAPGKFLKMASETGGIVFMDITELPDNFTLEFDLAQDAPTTEYRYKCRFSVVLTDTPDPERDVTEEASAGDHGIALTVERNAGSPSVSEFSKRAGRDHTGGSSASLIKHFNETRRGVPSHVAIWRQGKRVRMYINEQKVYDIPLAWNWDVPMAGLRFVSNLSDPSDAYFVGNIRLAEGAPDTRSKLEKEGKLTTYGITFASGSSEVEATSAGTLKQIAKVLEAKPDMRLRITGHTDADGSDETNLALSKSRAAAVGAVLTSNYGIAADRFETTGAGESSPVSTDNTPAAKAQNRRVVLEVI